MNSITKDAQIECGFIYQSILDEAENTGLTGSSEQLFINANLRSVLEDTIKQLYLARRKGLRGNNKEIEKKRNEEILYKVLKGEQQKQISHKHGITGAGINKILKKTIKEITGTNDTDLTVGYLLKFYKEDLDKYFIQQKIEARYESRSNNICS